MKKIAIVLIALPFLAFPSVSSAAQLTPAQANAILSVLAAFNADASLIAKVRALLLPPIAVPKVSTITPAPSGTINPTPIQPAPVAPLPIINPKFGSIVMEDKSAVVVSLAHIAPADAKNDLPYGSYLLKVQVLDASGNPVNAVPVSMNAPGNLSGEKIDRKIDTTTTLHSNDFYTQFEYIPTKKGSSVDLVFTSGNLSKTFTLGLQ